MAEARHELFCVLLPLGVGKLILPRSVVEEVRALAELQPLTGMPPWLAGQVRWRGGTIPLVAIEPLLGEPLPERSRRSRMVIVRTPPDTLELGVIAVLAQGFPYILRITPELLSTARRPENEALLAEVALGLERPLVPDLPALAEEAAKLLAA